MMLSKDVVNVLVDLIENRIAIMHIGDRDDLREMVALQRALSELRGTHDMEPGILKAFGDIPRRGRRRKISSMIGERD